jgi:glycosyltransferase involved in cell wall biosynthesis
MRLIHLHSGNLYGGVERALLAFACAAPPEVRQTFALGYDGRLRRELVAEGAEVITIGSARARAPWTIWRARRELTALVASRQTPVVVLAHSLWALAVLGTAAREAGALTALYLHNPPTSALWPDDWARRTQVDLAIANSRYTVEQSRPFLPAVPIEQLHPPVLLGLRSLADRPAVRRELGTAPGDVVILQASRMQEWKGHSVFIDALAALANVDGWTAWIAGAAQRPADRAYERSLRERVAAAGLERRVRFVGERADVPRLASAADIYCQPNREPEPFGVVFIEALAAGLPVVATAAGGAMEIVTNECGRLVPIGDPSALAATLRTLIADPRLRVALGERGPDRARALCDARTQAARLTEILTSAVGRCVAVS